MRAVGRRIEGGGGQVIQAAGEAVAADVGGVVALVGREGGAGRLTGGLVGPGVGAGERGDRAEAVAVGATDPVAAGAGVGAVDGDASQNLEFLQGAAGMSAAAPAW